MEENHPLISELASIVGSEHVITDSTSLSVYECDAATVFKALPDVVVFPTTTQEISAIVEVANKHNVPFIARGAGTGLSGGMLTCQRRHHYCIEPNESHP